MRKRVNLIIEEEILERIDEIAIDKNKRAAVIQEALLQFIAREEKKAAKKQKDKEIAEEAYS
jgi:metal-responsive CopG/Arc/MetJ family transcriptional regulator